MFYVPINEYQVFQFQKQNHIYPFLVQLWEYSYKYLKLLQARTNWEAKTCKNLIDPRIEVDSSLMETSVLIGLLCTQEDPSNRPGMDKVVEWLLFSDVPESNSEVRAMKRGEWLRKTATIKSKCLRSAKASTSA